MNILIVARGYPQLHNNMLGIFELDQAIALKKAGHRIAYAAIDIRSIRRKRKLGYNYFTDGNGIEVFEMNWPIGGIQQDLADYFCGKCFDKLYSHVKAVFGKPDIIHAHFLKIGTAAKGVCIKEEIPLVLTEHSSYINKENLSKAVARRALNTYGTCSAIITVSHPLAENIKKTTGFDSTVIHNIVSIGDAGANEIIESDDGTIRFVSAGNLLPRKGFDVLLRSFAKALTSGKNMKLLILGDGPERERLRTLSSELKISDSVTFYGKYRKEDLPELCKDAHAFVLASRAETFGVVYIEAMAMGLPVIATRCGGPEDFVDDSNGYLVDVEDINALSDALIRMSENYKSFNRQEIREHTVLHFSENTIAKQIDGVYRSVLKQKG